MNKRITRALVPALATAGLLGTGVPAASAASFVPCGTGNVQVCYDEVADTGFGFSIPRLGPGEHIDVASVAAYLDVYRLDLGGPGVQIPCVTLVVNGTAQDNCARIGLTLVSRTPLVEQFAAGVDLMKIDGVVARVYVCSALLTATAGGIGVTNFPLLAPCADIPPQPTV